MPVLASQMSLLSYSLHSASDEASLYLHFSELQVLDVFLKPQTTIHLKKVISRLAYISGKAKEMKRKERLQKTSVVTTHSNP